MVCALSSCAPGGPQGGESGPVFSTSPPGISTPSSPSRSPRPAPARPRGAAPTRPPLGAAGDVPACFGPVPKPASRCSSAPYDQAKPFLNAVSKTEPRWDVTAPGPERVRARAAHFPGSQHGLGWGHLADHPAPPPGAQLPAAAPAARASAQRSKQEEGQAAASPTPRSQGPALPPRWWGS